MKISLEKLKILWSKYNEYFLDCVYFNDFSVGGRKYRAGDEIRSADLQFFEKSKLPSIEVLFNEKFYGILTNEFPCEYRKPCGSLVFIDVDRQLEILDYVSTMSKRKRCIKLIGDLYRTDSVTGKRIMLASHDTPLDYKKWNEFKRFIDKEQKIFFRYSECGILIFVNMRPDAETDFMERFKKNTDLVTSIVSRKKDSKVEISPDFIPTEDVITVNDPAHLLAEYNRSNARMIIIGENISESYRSSLLEVKQYDRYVRMMVVPSINFQNIDHFLMQVRMVYNADRWNT